MTEDSISKENLKRQERLGEYFTYITVIMGLIIIQLPFPFEINRPIVILIALSTAAFSVVWHRLTPKDFTGRTKNFIEAVVDVVAISLVVNFTGGLNGYFLFLYFLPILNVAANMPLSFTFGIVASAFSFITIQGLADLETAGPKVLSVLGFHIWAIGLVASYGRLLSSEVSNSKKKEEDVKIEQLEEVSKLKDEFVFIISHELRSPITAIRGYLELLLNESSVKAAANAKLSKAFYTANKLANLVSLLLEVSRLETGKIRFYIQTINVKKTVEDALKGISTDAKEKKIDLVVSVPANYQVSVDPERLIEILTILVENAVRFTPEYGRVKIGSQRSLSRLTLSVEDSGAGISDEVKKHLFDKLYTQATNDKEIKGLGLGLYVAKSLMKAMKGDLEVKTARRKGTTFTLIFPTTSY
ncbi:MAG: HAMP domain-containing sensor histidine kinase [bacterium]|nr:HAMP domain-containing sensor histidine kinase [bacterium]